MVKRLLILGLSFDLMCHWLFKRTEDVKQAALVVAEESLYEEWINKDRWQGQVKEALRIANTNLESIPTPAGEMPVILGPGWPGVMLHEAVGHGLEGDFNRKGTSIFQVKLKK